MKKSRLLFALFFTFSCVCFGQIWTPKAAGVLPANVNVFDVSVVSDQIIWAVCGHYDPNGPFATDVPTVILSTDGGETWAVKTVPGANDRYGYDIHAFDENTACITTQNLDNWPGRGIFRTTDGGQNWTETLNHVAGGVWVHFFDDSEGVCINGRHIGRTLNGGQNWTTTEIPFFQPNEGNILNSAATSLATLGDRLWVGTWKGRIFRSTNRGVDWQVFNTGLGNLAIIYSIDFSDEQNGLALYYFESDPNTNLLARTTDGGEHWTAVPTSTIFSELAAIPCTKTFIATHSWTQPGGTSYSTDLGATWTALGDTAKVWAPFFASPEHGWLASATATGAKPALYKWSGAGLYGRIYVNQNATGANNGKGWADAFTDLKTALAAAQEGDEIWVAEGTYTPVASGMQTAVFITINQNLKLYGGFAGTECNLSERDVVLHPTILSGDLNGDDVPDDFITNRDDNVKRVVLVTASVSNETVIDGFTIKSGHANGIGPQKSGGGMDCYGAPIIRNCVFAQNYALGNGGGIAMNSGSEGFALDGCTFRHNFGNVGGGLVITSTQFTVENCTFIGNDNHPGTLDPQGGGIYLTNPNPGTIRNCHFLENSSFYSGGGVWAWTTSDNTQSSLLVADCTFENNTAGAWGGGMIFVPWGDNAKYTVENCHFQGNEAEFFGAFSLDVNVNASGTKALLDNCTFSQNHAADVGGFGLWGEGKNMNIEVNACHFMGNTADSESGGADFLGTAGATGKVVIDSCLFEGNAAPYVGGLSLGNYHTGGAEVDYELTNSTFMGNQTMDYGGGILLITDQPSKCQFLVENCLIEDNSTSAGNGGGVSFVPSTSETHATFRATRFIGNHSSGDGGAVHIFQYLSNLPFPTNASCIFENCLFAGNTSAGATISADSLPNLQFLNCTIAGNTGGGIQLSDQSSLSLQNTILYNPNHTEYQALTNDVTFTSNGGNLIGDGSLAGQLTATDKQNLDPLFAGVDDYHLGAGSPCIDMGVDLGNLPALDLDGNARISGSTVDIGSYERQTVAAQEVIVGELSVSPNPAVAFLILQLPEAITGQFDVEVFDAQGKLLRRQSLDAGQRLDVQGLAAGMYALKAVAGKRVFIGKFVKQ